MEASLIEVRIQANSESLLLRLPPEIKNCIWAYVLGGKVLDVKCFENYEKSHVRDTTAISQDSFPEYSHALLQVCRQIYTETALLPFSKNTFRFDMVDAFEWARHLLDVQRALLEKVHIVTNTTECKLLRYFPIDFFPGLKQIVVEVHPFAFQGWRYVVGQDPERYRTWFTANIGRMAKPIQEAKPDVRVTIMHVYTD